jgi:hypothetical protein
MQHLIQEGDMAEKDTQEKALAIPTAGQIFPDGTAIELLRDSSSPEKFTLVRSRQDFLEIRPQVIYDNRTFVPVSISPNVARAVRFPTRVAPPESSEKLFTDLHALLSRYLGQLDSCTTAMVFTAFASWFAPVLQAAPVLSIFAPPGSPKSLVTQILNMVCRRPLRIVGLTRSDMARLPLSLGPTLLLDEPDLGFRTQMILRASSQRGTHIAAGRDVVDVFAAKIMVSSRPMYGPSADGDELRVTLVPISGNVPPLERRAEENIADEFQARFLGYFLRNFDKVRVPTFDVSRLAVPAQVLARTLGSAVIGDDKLQAKIIPILAIQDEELRAERASAIESIVLEALLFFIHHGGWDSVRTQQVAEKVAEIYEGRKSDRKDLSPESVGWAIKRLRIPSGRINRASNGVELGGDICRLVHRLAVSYGVPALQSGFRRGCRYCEELESASNQQQSRIGGMAHIV